MPQRPQGAVGVVGLQELRIRIMYEGIRIGRAGDPDNYKGCKIDHRWRPAEKAISA